MKRLGSFAFALILTLPSLARADFLTTFENAGLGPDSFNNNAGGGQFLVNGNGFNNFFDSTFNVWSGWALSSKSTAVGGADFNEQYGSAPLTGAGGSQTYAVAFTNTPTVPFPTNHPDGSIINLAPGTSPVSIAVTNSLYAYRSMTEGDSFAKKFGPGDFMQLDIRGFKGADGGGGLVGEVDFLLANGTDILNTWKTLDLSSLAGAESLRFGISSSDNGDFGINTPAFVAIDNFRTRTNSTSTPEPGTLVLLTGFLGTMVMYRWKRRDAAAA